MRTAPLIVLASLLVNSDSLNAWEIDGVKSGMRSGDLLALIGKNGAYKLTRLPTDKKGEEVLMVDLQGSRKHYTLCNDRISEMSLDQASGSRAFHENVRRVQVETERRGSPVTEFISIGWKSIVRASWQVGGERMELIFDDETPRGEKGWGINYVDVVIQRQCR